jgi:hypothetical protein
MKEFGAGEPKQKMLCYDVRAAVISTLAYLEMIEDAKSDPIDVDKHLKGAIKQCRWAAEKIEDLYKEISNAESRQV